MPDTPLFVKTHDFIVWLLRHTHRFPRAFRHSYTNRVENAAFDFERSILMANTYRSERRRDALQTADAHLVCWRSLMRYAYALGLLNPKQVEYAVQRLDELGRLLGAWIKGSGR